MSTVENPDGGITNKERREERRHLQKEAFQLANYYFVFQGVIFTAFYNVPSALKCRYRWIPFVLSLLAGLLNLCALLSIACKYKALLDDIDRITVARRGNQRPAPAPEYEPIPVRMERFCRLLCLVFCMAMFVGFLVITLIGSLKLTCGGRVKGQSTVGAPPPD